MIEPLKFTHVAAGLAFAVLLGLPHPASAEAAEAETEEPELDAGEVIARAVEALGGEVAWEAVETLEMTGSHAAFSSPPSPFRIVRQRPNLYRFEYREAIAEVIVAYDGEKAWWDNDTPFAEVHFPSHPPLPYALAYRADAEFGFPFLDWRQKGHRTTYLGVRDLEGLESHAVELTLAHGPVETWYFSTDDFLPVGRVSSAGFKGLPAEQRLFFSDYREVGDLRLPFYVEIEVGNRFSRLEVEKVELGVELDPSLFSLPLEEPIAGLQDLAGTWRIELQTRMLPGLPWLPGETTATVETRFDGRMLEEEISFLFVGQPRTIKRLWTWDRFEGVLRVVQVDDLTAHANVLEGPAPVADGTLELTNLETGTEWQVMGRTYHDRLVLRRSSPESFEIDLDRSTDGGATWESLARFKYVRENSG